MKRLCLIVMFALLLFFFTTCGKKDTPVLNMDFETQDLEGWQFSERGYTCSLDKTTASEGTQSLSLAFVEETRGHIPGFAVTRLPVESFKGKRVRLTASLKTQKVERDCQIWLRADNPESDPLAFTSLGRFGPKKTTEWKTFHLEMDVPMETTSLYFGFTIRGKGRAWLDNVETFVKPAQGQPQITLAGKVRDEKDQPVSNAQVAVKMFFHETALALTGSDEKGNFSFRLPPGQYRLCVTAPGLTAASLPPGNYREDKRDLLIKLKGNAFTRKGKVNLPPSITSLPPDSYVVAVRLDFFDADMYYFRPEADGSFAMTLPALKEGFKVDLDAPGLKAPPAKIGPEDKKELVLEAAAPEPAPEAVIQWMKKTALPLKSVEPGQGYDDLQPLKEIIGNARVVGFGESSHGQREIFQMKHRVFEFLVEQMGFTVFVMEEAWPIGFEVNEYVLHGKGDIRTAAGNLHTIWNTEEVYALIRWMREYNADPAHTRKVKFYGMDLSSSKGAADMVAEYISRIDKTSAQKVLTVLKPLRSKRVWAELYDYDDILSRTLRNNLKDLFQLFGAQKEEYIKASSRQEWSLMRQHVKYLGNFTDYALSGRTSDIDAINVRDRGMADTVNWILENEPPGVRVALWAHNFHVASAPYPGHPFTFAGMHLKNQLRADYLSVGFIFNHGGFQSFDLTAQNTFFLLKGFKVGPYADSYGTAMARTGFPSFFLDLRELPETGPVHEWFAEPHVYKWMDSVYANEKDIQFLFRLPETFDAVIFIDETSRARPNYPVNLLKFF